MPIPMVDLKAQYHALKSEIDARLLEVLESSQFILGQNVKEFEEECADYLDVKYAISVASGTDALHLALLAAGIGPGDEVITSSFSFIATAEAILYTGATPVFVDIERTSFNLNLEQVEQAITAQTRAVVPVHLFGQPVNMPRLMHLCQSKGIKVIEDCAQSFGAQIGDKHTGSFGELGAFSFFPSKNLGAYGDGGMIVTNSEALAKRVNALRNHGSRRRYHHEMLGYNSRLDELQAAILRIKLKHIDEYNQRRYQIAQDYHRNLDDCDVQTPVEDHIGRHVYHQYTCLHTRRDQIINTLSDVGIASAVYYPIPLHRQKVFAQKYHSLSLPVSESIARTCFSLPIYPELADAQVEHICDTIKVALLQSEPQPGKARAAPQTDVISS